MTLYPLYTSPLLNIVLKTHLIHQYRANIRYVSHSELKETRISTIQIRDSKHICKNKPDRFHVFRVHCFVIVLKINPATQACNSLFPLSRVSLDDRSIANGEITIIELYFHLQGSFSFMTCIHCCSWQHPSPKPYRDQ